VGFSESYLGRLRAQVGSQRLLVVAVRVFVEDTSGRILILRRSDTGLWGLAGGMMDLGESVEDALRRELREETALEVGALTVFGLSSAPMVEDHTYPNGDAIQSVAVLAHARCNAGQVRASDGEATEVRFVAPGSIAADWFSPPEFPGIGLYRRWRETGAFQLA
jgi:ADP-ribose pyrophosphatase YjhB (NUDIX family)